MKVIYVGNFYHHSVGEPEIAATFEQLGHEVVRMQENEVSIGDIKREVALGADMVLFAKFRTKDTFTARDEFIRFCPIPCVCWVFDLYIGI